MKPFRCIAVLCLGIPMVHGATTINPALKSSWAGNIGWIDWQGEPASGAATGEYVCSGFLWSANCGWIHLGDGSPADGIRYSNGNAEDYGVNLVGAYSTGTDCRVKLRGCAYGANIGWIVFNDQGNAELSLHSGRITGFTWSANCGWIDLDDETWFVKSDVILPGVDSDDDGIADAYEYEHGDPESLDVFTKNGDFDGDGETDVEEYLAGTDPADPLSVFRITEFTVSTGGISLGWTSSPGRNYQIQGSNVSPAGPWNLTVDGIMPAGTQTSRSIPMADGPTWFFRIAARMPLAP